MVKKNHKSVGINGFLFIFAWCYKDPDPDVDPVTDFDQYH
jgi:hypothetical protein